MEMVILVKHRKFIILIVSILFLTIGISGIFIYLHIYKSPYEPNVRVGSIRGSTINLQKQLDDSKIGFSCNTDPTIKNNQCNIMFENPETNNKLLTFKLVLENGTILYKSKFVKIGTFLNSININNTLAKGKYSGYLYVYGYNQDSLQQIKQNVTTVARITIHVL